ncbi:MAG: RNA polymerase sigma factor [Planctomycetes bacterium]|nr:RNA polymerase sigma factor [Planctomycetota bacterium]
MSDRAPDSAPESLLAHEPWLGALARHLVRDEEEAEEVVQETLRRALEAPPREAGALRSFLGSIARNFVYDGARRRRRRAERERAAARAEPLPATIDLLARLDRQRDVLDAVRELEEPFREAILLRFYEELKPRVIARRLGIPVATVKSRLRRGQERLRAKLAARYGEREWRAALAPLLVAPITSFGTAAIAPLAALALAASFLAAALQLAGELAPREGELSPPAAATIAASSGPRRAKRSERFNCRASSVASRSRRRAPRPRCPPRARASRCAGPTKPCSGSTSSAASYAGRRASSATSAPSSWRAPRARSKRWLRAAARSSSCRAESARLAPPLPRPMPRSSCTCSTRTGSRRRTCPSAFSGAATASSACSGVGAPARVACMRRACAARSSDCCRVARCWRASTSRSPTCARACWAAALSRPRAKCPACRLRRAGP